MITLNSMVLQVGIKIRNGDTELDPMQRAKVASREPFGLYHHPTPDSVYIFDRCTDDLFKYVLAHEVGHLMSHRCGGDYFKFYDEITKSGKSAFYFIWDLQYKSILEELSADFFAMHLLAHLDIESHHLFFERTQNYARHASSEQICNMYEQSLRLFNEFIKLYEQGGKL